MGAAQFLLISCKYSIAKRVGFTSFSNFFKQFHYKTHEWFLPVFQVFMQFRRNSIVGNKNIFLPKSLKTRKTGKNHLFCNEIVSKNWKNY